MFFGWWYWFSDREASSQILADTCHDPYREVGVNDQVQIERIMVVHLQHC